MASSKKHLVKLGNSSLETMMTEKQALQYGKKAMPEDLRRAGFVCVIFQGDNFLRINYAKK